MIFLEMGSALVAFAELNVATSRWEGARATFSMIPGNHGPSFRVSKKLFSAIIEGGL